MSGVHDVAPYAGQILQSLSAPFGHGERQRRQRKVGFRSRR
jgi:hypothetical protein